MTIGIFYEAQPEELRSEIQAVLKSGQVAVTYLLFMDFLDEPVRLCNRTIEIQDGQNGETWQPYLANFRWQDIAGGPDQLAPLRTYSLTVPRDLAPQFINAAGPIPSVATKETYHHREASMWLQLLKTGDKGQDVPLGYPTALHSGLMDAFTWSNKPEGLRFNLRVEGKTSRGRVPGSGTMTPRDQKRRFATDLGLDFVPEIPIREPRWPRY